MAGEDIPRVTLLSLVIYNAITEIQIQLRPVGTTGDRFSLFKVSALQFNFGVRPAPVAPDGLPARPPHLRNHPVSGTPGLTRS